MSHLLATVNPDAAAAIQPEPGRLRLPDVGEVVKYHMRLGFGRDGRTYFPALVQGHGPQDTLDLTIVVDSNEIIDERQVPEIAIGQQFHVWERPEPVRPLAERLEQPAGLLGEVKSLESLILGEYDRPNVSIIGIMVDFENRLRAVAQENKSLRTLLEASGAPTPEVRKAAKKGKRK